MSHLSSALGLKLRFVFVSLDNVLIDVGSMIVQTNNDDECIGMSASLASLEHYF